MIAHHTRTCRPLLASGLAGLALLVACSRTATEEFADVVTGARRSLADGTRIELHDPEGARATWVRAREAAEIRLAPARPEAAELSLELFREANDRAGRQDDEPASTQSFSRRVPGGESTVLFSDALGRVEDSVEGRISEKDGAVIRCVLGAPFASWPPREESPRSWRPLVVLPELGLALDGRLDEGGSSVSFRMRANATDGESGAVEHWLRCKIAGDFVETTSLEANPVVCTAPVADWLRPRSDGCCVRVTLHRAHDEHAGPGLEVAIEAPR
jgi:hypothetical protein